MRIAIDGAQSTGKSTLFELLRPSFGNRFTFIQEASRTVAPRFGVRGAEDWQSLLLNKAELERFFSAEEEWQQRQQSTADSGFVIDSSLMLTWAYRRHFSCGDPKDLSLTTQYDLVLYCPPNSDLALSDGFRFLDGQHAVDSVYRRIVTEAFTGTFVVLAALSERLADASKAIERTLDKSCIR